MLQRRKAVLDIRPAFLPANLLGDGKLCGLLSGFLQFCQPFAVTAVEEEHATAFPHAQDRKEIIGLRRGQPNLCPGKEGLINEQALR